MTRRFNGDVAFEDVIEASGVEMAKGGLYFAKQYRNCESIASFLGAVRMALSAKDKKIQGLTDDLAKLAERHSAEASKRADLAVQNGKLLRTAFARGLEATDLSETTQERLLTVSS